CSDRCLPSTPLRPEMHRPHARHPAGIPWRSGGWDRRTTCPHPYPDLHQWPLFWGFPTLPAMPAARDELRRWVRSRRAAEEREQYETLAARREPGASLRAALSLIALARARHGWLANRSARPGTRPAGLRALGTPPASGPVMSALQDPLLRSMAAAAQ